MLTYDEPANVQRLTRLDRTRKAAFAAACAQRLLPLFERYAAAVEADPRILQEALDGVWDALRGTQVDLRPMQAAAEDQVPQEDDDWILETGYAQNAAACAAYAVRTWLTDDAQEAAWASRQVYELADYAVQQLLPDLDLNRPDAEAQLLGHELVQTALAGIEHDLSEVESAELDLAQLAYRASHEGLAWSRGMP